MKFCSPFQFGFYCSAHSLLHHREGEEEKREEKMFQQPAESINMFSGNSQRLQNGQASGRPSRLQSSICVCPHQVPSRVSIKID